jgi:group I intron endonuclease
MLIWQTYWQKPLNRLIADVVGTNIKSGIYKITNIKTKECYIGQAVNIAERFKQHCKAGCGIDTPAGNKLYKAMQEYGIQNFSWEVLEEVPPAALNEKEAYYINLYDSKNFGYNSNIGINKK